MGFGLTKKIFDSLCVLCGLCEKPDLEGLSLARSLCSLENTEDAEKTLIKTVLVEPQKDLLLLSVISAGSARNQTLKGLSLARSLCSLENTEDAEKILRKTGLVKPQKDLCFSLRSLRALRETSP